MKKYKLYKKYKKKYKQLAGMQTTSDKTLEVNCNSYSNIKDCCLNDLCNFRGEKCINLGKSTKNKICEKFTQPIPNIDGYPSYENIFSAKQYFINAHGFPPTISYEGGIRSNLPLGLSDEERKTYAKTFTEGEIPLKNFTNIIPDKTIVVTVTPPNHFLMFDKNELIPLQIMDFLSKDTLLGILLDKKELSKIISEFETKSEKYSNIDWIPSFLNNIQVYKPGDYYFNNEQVFESTEISDVFDLNLGWELTRKIQKDLLDDSIKSSLDTEDSYELSSGFEEALKTLNLPPKYDVQEVMGIQSERGGVKIESLGPKATRMTTNSYFKEQSTKRSIRNLGREDITLEGYIYDHPYYPWSLSGIVNTIRSRVPDDEWIVIYDFVCNPALDEDDKEIWGKINFNLINTIRKDLTEVGKSNTEILGENFYKFTGFNVNNFIDKMSVADTFSSVFERDE